MRFGDATLDHLHIDRARMGRFLRDRHVFVVIQQLSKPLRQGFSLRLLEIAQTVDFAAEQICQPVDVEIDRSWGLHSFPERFRVWCSDFW
jgi:hypothetical protein